MPDEMEEIIADFITEAEESLDRIDPLFVELENRGTDREMLNEIFRSMHTLKGAAGFLGFPQIVEVAHAAENIMKKMRDGEIAASRSLIDAVLKAVDMLRLLLRHIKTKDGAKEETGGLLSELANAVADAPERAGDRAAENPSESSAAPGGEDCAAPMAEEPVGRPVPVTKGRLQADASNGPSSASEGRDSTLTLRVEIDRIDKVMNLTGEIVLVRNRLLNIVNYLESRYDDPYIDRLFDAVGFLDLVTSDVQLAVMRMRMQPVKKVFSRFPRLARDIAASLGKEVELTITGEETEVDKSVIEQIGDPMVHIIRNAIDHGIEPSAERRARGKPDKGTISISACQKGSQIMIEVSDDGRGVDIERVKGKAVEKGLISQEEGRRMTDDDALDLIFAPGFSTCEVATELSGRGVGMDVVRTNVSRLNGYVQVSTKMDLGTKFVIGIPLTLAIVDALMVTDGGSHYALPLSSVEEIVKITSDETKDAAGRKVLTVRNRVYPLFELSDILGRPKDGVSGRRYALVAAVGENRFCLAVDELLGQEEVVIKNVEGIDAASSRILGVTITGDGRVVLILDLAGISRGLGGLARN